MKRRWGLRILLCLLLGVITTVGIAWSCGRWSRLDPGSQKRWPQARTAPVDDGSATASMRRYAFSMSRFRGIGIEQAFIWTHEVWSEMPDDRDPLAQALNLGSMTNQPLDQYEPLPAEEAATLPRWGPLDDVPRESLVDRQLSQRIFVAQGWPWPALWCEQVDWKGNFLGGIFLETEHSPPNFFPTSHVLALRPSWPGLLASIALYGGAWFTGLFGYTATRRGWRKYRGRCLACGYDLRALTSERCPECGATCAIGSVRT